MVGSLIAQWAADQAVMYFALWLNGMTVVRECDPTAGSMSWFSSFSLDTCRTGTGAGVEPRALPGYIAGLGAPPHPYIRMLGIQTITPFGAIFCKEGKDYGIVPYAIPGPRPRPWFGPIAFPFAPPGVSPVARPGRVPFNVRPWPVWAGSPPRPGVDGGYAPPGVGAGGERDSTIPPPWSWAWDPSRPIAPPQNPPVARAVPQPGTKETKVGANTAAGQMFFALMRAKEAVSEMEDFVEAMYKALPRATQRRYSKDLGSMLLALYENWDSFDFKLFFRNLLANQIEDEIIGRAFFGLKGKARDAVFGNSMGALPGGHTGLKEFARAVADAVSASVNPFFGYGDKAEHRLDRLNREDREKRARDILRRMKAAGLTDPANQSRQGATGNPAR